MTIRSKITGVGGYVPSRTIRNQDLSQWMDTSDEWIRQRTGIEQRHWVEADGTNLDLAFEATQLALKDAGIVAQDLDMIIYATLSPDFEFPGGACLLQARLGLSGCGALDIRQQCSGFIYGLSIADRFIRSGGYRNILLVGSEVHSKGIDISTKGRDVSVLFGDGAGAVVVSATDGKSSVHGRESMIFSTHIHADGKFAKDLWTASPGAANGKNRIDLEALERGDHFPQMNGKTVFTHAVKKIPEVIQEALSANGLKLDEVDLFVLHQANLRINEMVAKQLNIPSEKVFNTIQQFGNTTAATIPLGLFEAKKRGVLNKGMIVMSAAFGSGFTWGAAVYRW